MNKFNQGDDDAMEGNEDEKQEEQKQVEQKLEEKTETKKEIIEIEKKEEETNKSKVKGYETQSETILPKEDAFDFKEPVKSYFKKIQIVQDKSKFTEEELNNYGGSYGMFYCSKKFGEELYCDQASLLSCSNYMKLNRRIYGSKPHYLLNNG